MTRIDKVCRFTSAMDGRRGISDVLPTKGKSVFKPVGGIITVGSVTKYTRRQFSF